MTDMTPAEHLELARLLKLSFENNTTNDMEKRIKVLASKRMDKATLAQATPEQQAEFWAMDKDVSKNHFPRDDSPQAVEFATGLRDLNASVSDYIKSAKSGAFLLQEACLHYKKMRGYDGRTMDEGDRTGPDGGYASLVRGRQFFQDTELERSAFEQILAGMEQKYTRAFGRSSEKVLFDHEEWEKARKKSET